MYDPWTDAARRYPRVHIEWIDLAPSEAAWVEESDVILIDESLSCIQRRCALAHELAHMDVGDRPTELCWFAARQETAADKLAARRLLDVRDLAESMQWAADPRELAHELKVTPRVLAIRWRWMHPWERGTLSRIAQRWESVA